MPLTSQATASRQDAATGSPAAPMQAERDRFVALAFCWADTLIELDAERKVVYAAGLTMAITGLGPEQLTGRPIADVMPEGQEPELRRLLDIAGQCGRVDNVSIGFIGPDGGGVAADLAVQVLPEIAGRSFLAMRLAGAAAADSSGPAAAGDAALLDEQSFIDAARRALAQRGAQGGHVLTLLAIPELATLKQTLEERSYCNLSNTIAGYLRARSADRNAGGLGDGRYGLVHGRDLDVDRLEAHLLSMVAGFAPADVTASAESASIVANDSLADETLGQVVVHAVRQFREADDTAATLRQLRENLPKVAADAAEMAATFSRLVESKGFHIAFQPVVASDGGDILFFEGLARIDGRGEESPHRYISYAEETGQICAFDLAMVEKAMAWLKERNRPDIRVSANISGRSMLNPDFITRLHQLLEADPDRAGQLALEITDCSRISDLDAIGHCIQSLRQRADLVGLDDFSTGIDGFRMLTALDVDFVKFRAPPEAGSAEPTKASALLEALTGFCSRIGVRTVATAVETADRLAALRASGVDYVQGYLFGRPSPDIGSFR